MNYPKILRAALVLLPILSAGILAFGGPARDATAATDAYRCGEAALYFPASGEVGWKHQDPDSTDWDAQGNPTRHTGVDIFSVEGGAIYAPADGYVSRNPGAESMNIVLPGVRNALTGVDGIELYLSHIMHAGVMNQTFKAGDVIALQLGDHLHYSVGAFIGYDDREIEQTQDPSPYFNATLSYNPAVADRHDMDYWCLAPGAFDPVANAVPVSLTATRTPPPIEFKTGENPTSFEPAEIRIARQDCLPDGRVAIVMPSGTVKAGDWVDLSIFNNGFASDFIGKRSESGAFRWEGLMAGSPHFLRINRPLANGGWVTSTTLPFLTRTDC